MNFDDMRNDSRKSKLTRGDLRILRRLASYLHPQRRLVATSLSLTLLMTGIQLAQPYLIKVAIDTHIQEGNLSGLRMVAIAFLALLMAEALLNYFQIYITHLTGQRVMRHIREKVFSHTQRLSSAFFDRTPIGKIMTRVTSDVETLNEFLSQGVVAIMQDVILLAGILTVMVAIHLELTLITFVVIPPLLLVVRFLRGRLRHLYDLVRTRVAQINAFLQESISGMDIIQAFVQEEENLSKFDRLNRRHLDANLSSVFYASILSAVIELASVLSIVLVIGYGGRGVLSGTVTLGILAAFVDYIRRFYRPIEDLSDRYDIVLRSVVSARKIFGHLDTEIEIRDPIAPVPLHTFERAIEFDRVHFAYLPEKPVLRDVSLRIERGEKVAVVGATGAGKSTLIKLLNRLYDVTSGTIRIDGVDIREVSLHDLRTMMGLVQQDVFLFSDSIGANIDLTGRLGSDRIRSAARTVQAHRFIERRDRGYSALLGERGASLSFGERQLLAFARALAADPPILILDEATSSVDSGTESMIQQALKVLLRDRTALIIAHRLSTIREVDRIVVMHHGEIREEGTHRELFRRDGIYTRLYRLQYELGASRKVS
jgi:ATP-binding cassette subfamily B protein